MTLAVESTPAVLDRLARLGSARGFDGQNGLLYPGLRRILRVSRRGINSIFDRTPTANRGDGILTPRYINTLVLIAGIGRQVRRL